MRGPCVDSDGDAKESTIECNQRHNGRNPNVELPKLLGFLYPEAFTPVRVRMEGILAPCASGCRLGRWSSPGAWTCKSCGWALCRRRTLDLGSFGVVGIDVKEVGEVVLLEQTFFK